VSSGIDQVDESILYTQHVHIEIEKKGKGVNLHTAGNRPADVIGTEREREEEKTVLKAS
jgi:ribosomal protein S3